MYSRKTRINSNKEPNPSHAKHSDNIQYVPGAAGSTRQ